NAATAHIPIIFITALDSEEHTVKGLDIGADDYIPKPLSMREVKARVRAVLRRMTQQKQVIQNSVSYEGIELFPDTKTLTVDGRDVLLTRLEFEILSFLLSHRGRVYSRQELIDRLWPDDTIVLERTVDVNITRLRKKIEPYGEHIKTKIGYGYYFAE
ncbi:MAG: response regulator transcription factor, partial [Bacteroidaceae bacterium]|nr:response regulator transcription factor [Bacteroidaceae bacterium]